MTQVVGGMPASAPSSNPSSPSGARPPGLTRMQRRAKRRERGRVAARSVGEILITLGVVTLSFVAYQLWWTNLTADVKSNNIKKDLVQQFQAAPALPVTPVQPAKLTVGEGQGFGLMYIPRLGKNWVEPIIQGETLSNLAKGVTHYRNTAMPGEVGNFAVAGHRATHGQPFAYLDQLEAGDLVYVQTADEWFTYKMRSTEIVKPTRYCVLLPVPCEPGAEQTKQVITLTTCNPRWGSTGRLIWYGDFLSRSPKSAGPPPALTGIA